MSKYPKLRGRIVEKFESQKAFSERIGLSEQSITAKLNDRAGFSIEDIVKWCNELEIKQDEVGVYFFANDFQNGKVSIK